MERGNQIRSGQTDGRYSVKARIPILSFLFLALIFSCKSVAQSGAHSSSPVVVPETETLLSQSPEPIEVVEVVDTSGNDEEVPPGSGIDAEDGLSEASEVESEETVAEIEQPESIEIEEAEEVPEEPEIEETPEITEAPIQEELQEVSVQAVEESAPLPEPPPIEPQVVQAPTPVAPPPPPPAASSPVQPPVQSQVPVQPPAPSPAPQVQPPPATSSPATPPPVASPPVPPAASSPAQQSQVPERTAPSNPPLPPPFLGPAEPERPPPVRQEVPPPVLPELPSPPRNETPETPIVFSRVVRMTVGQMLEVPFRGTGWVYQGELGNRRGINYESTRTDTERGVTLGQSIIFRAEAVGTYILRFYRRDYIQDYIINDYVQVIVGEADDSGRGRTGTVIDRGRVVAEPRWPYIQEAAGSSSETVSPPATEATTGTAVGTTAEPQRPDAVQVTEPTSPAVSGSAPATSAPSQAAASPPVEVVTPEEYVRRAKQEFDAGHVEQALAIIEQMRQRYPSGTDEAWWLLGQLYEANSPARDIRQSLECYRTLVNEYPQSNRIDDARRRIAYLERYYLNIR
jgi:hypothetical protein